MSAVIKPHFRRMIAAFTLSAIAALNPCPAQSPASLVNPFIGTGGHGHTFPGATVPFGMVQLSPDTRLEGWDGCSAYHYSDSVIYGFSHTHLSGTGCSDYGDILLMPVPGPVPLKDYAYASRFGKGDETASAGYYRVTLHGGKVQAELTATTRAGFHRYTFRDSEQPAVVLDLEHRDMVIESGLRITGPDEIEGYRISRAWADRQMVWFVAKFSKPFTSYSISSGDNLVMGLTDLKGENIKALFQFGNTGGESLLVKVGISGVDAEGARRNLLEEIPAWDFDTVAARARDRWDDALGKIRIDHASREQQVIFYTALYHALLQPNLYSDTDGRYRGRDLKVHRADSFGYYTVFSLWDTYRAANPLYTILEPDRTRDFIRTFLRQYEEGGMLPVWELSGNETGCMIGYHAVPVIADAWVKGIRGYDGEKALEAMKHSANQDHLGLKYYREKGYIPGDKEGESVSKTLEYAYDDWCIAMMAQSLGKQEDYKTFIMRAQSYKNLYDRMTGFMRPKTNDTWVSPFDPAEVNFHYTEANAWQYSFYVPQDLNGLMRLHGGRENFTLKLDQLFTADTKTTGRDQADITGLIGQYAHGNEPSHHMAYLYDYAGAPWKTQEMVHRICGEFYHNAPDGLIGNEDCGQMSAWYIFSALGFYPVTPASGIYAIGTPAFPKATVRLANEKQFTIRAVNISDRNFYIQSATLNGMPYTKCYISHEDILKGGELTFHMGPMPNKAWATGYGSFPESRITDYQVVPVPAFYQGSPAFMDSTVTGLISAVPGNSIHYTLDGDAPTPKTPVYRGPMTLRKSVTIRALAVSQEGQKSLPVEAKFTRIPKNRRITVGSAYAGQYAAGGDVALIDFLRGGENFKTGRWQGYEGVDLVATVDLGAVQPVKSVSLGCLQDQGAWIFMPEAVTFEVSENGKDFTPAATVRNDVDERHQGAVVKEFTCKPGSGKVRYIRVIAKNRGVCPEWHLGAGGKAWIFADEITIE